MQLTTCIKHRFASQPEVRHHALLYPMQGVAQSTSGANVKSQSNQPNVNAPHQPPYSGSAFPVQPRPSLNQSAGQHFRLPPPPYIGNNCPPFNWPGVYGIPPPPPPGFPFPHNYQPGNLNYNYSVPVSNNFSALPEQTA